MKYFEYQNYLKTYQNFFKKRLARPLVKSPILQRTQPIFFKAQISQGVVKLFLNVKYKRTYENIWGELKVRPQYTPWRSNFCDLLPSSYKKCPLKKFTIYID